MGRSNLGRTIERIEEGWESAPDLSVDDFAGLSLNEWAQLQAYLREKSAYCFGARTWRDFNRLLRLSDSAPTSHLETSERLSELLREYAQGLDTSAELESYLAAIGTLGSLPWPMKWNSDHFWYQASENARFEMDSILALTNSHPNLFDDLDTEGILLLSDFGLSQLITHTGVPSVSSAQRLVDERGPEMGEFNFTMASVLIALWTQDAAYQGELLVSPRALALLMDEEDSIQPWWLELMIWQDVVGKLKEGDPTAHYEWLGEATAIRGFLDGAMNRASYPDENTYNQILQDRELFLDLRSFLN